MSASLGAAWTQCDHIVAAMRGICLAMSTSLGSFLINPAARFLASSIHEGCGPGCQHKQIEDYRPGYPRYSALVGAHRSFHVCRRFSNVRARLLLLKQDRIAVLEAQLELIDAQEQAPLFLGSSREDSSPERRAVLSELDTALSDYDNFLLRNQQVLNFPDASPRDVESLQNWHDNNACLSWEETEYLTRCKDLLSVVPLEAHVSAPLEQGLEQILLKAFQTFRNPQTNTSRDEHVHLFSEKVTRSLTRAVALFLIILAVSIPIVICATIDSTSIHLGISVLSIAIFLMMLASLTSIRLAELFIAGATYATVLTVFIPGQVSMET